MKNSVNCRNLVKELLENEYLLITYVETYEGGFDLSVRINQDKIEEENRLQQINGTLKKG